MWLIQDRNDSSECPQRVDSVEKVNTSIAMLQHESIGNVEVVIRQLLRSIDNRNCADCKANLVHEIDVFASIGIGVWLCEECSVCHTLTLGRGITLVKKAIAIGTHCHSPTYSLA